MRVTIAALLVALTLSACATSPFNPTSYAKNQQVGKLKVGMTVQQARSLVGRPRRIILYAGSPEIETHICNLVSVPYSDDGNPSNQARRIHLQFVEGRMVKSMSSSSLSRR